MEHVTLVKEPGSEYLGHYTVESGSAVEISKRLLEYDEGNNVDLKSQITVGCDGTTVSTGGKGARDY